MTESKTLTEDVGPEEFRETTLKNMRVHSPNPGRGVHYILYQDEGVRILAALRY